MQTLRVKEPTYVYLQAGMQLKYSVLSLYTKLKTLSAKEGLLTAIEQSDRYDQNHFSSEK